MLMEPTLASDLLPIAALSTFSFFEALISTDLFTFEPSIAIDPTLAFDLLPIAAFKTFSFLEALINTDLLIFEPSAMADRETALATVKIMVVANIFMLYFLGVC